VAESFWDFSVRTYRCKGVPAASLALQNQCGADVNVLLFCCWMGATRGQFTAANFAGLTRFSNTWAERVVRPLRGVRSWMKLEGCQDPLLANTDCMDLREQVKAVEFAAEQLQEQVMQTLFESVPAIELSASEQVDAALHNLQRYCEAEEIGQGREVQEHLAVILRAVFGPAVKSVLWSDPVTAQRD